jgi:AhpC/TSA family
MSFRKFLLLSCCSAAMMAVLALSSAIASDPVDSGLVDLGGKSAALFPAQQVKCLLFFFVRSDCPVSNRYAPEMQRLAERYEKTGVMTRLVYSDVGDTPERIQKHRLDFSLRMEALRDPRGCFAKRSKILVTPEAALYRPNGELLYHGRIDDRYVEFGKERPEALEHDLERALDAALEGRQVPAASRSAVGCSIGGD